MRKAKALIGLVIFLVFLITFYQLVVTTKLDFRESLKLQLEVEQLRYSTGINFTQIQQKPKDGVKPLSLLPLNIIPGYERIPDRKVLSLHCNSCALVSSSGHLFHSNAGMKIDSADCVIRMNAAPTIGYQKDVGYRTDIRVIGYTNIIRQSALNIKEKYQKWMFGHQNYSTKYAIIHWGHSPLAKMKKSQEYSVLYIFSQFYKNVQFYTFTSSKTHSSVNKVKASTKKNRFRRFKPSTGWFSMLFALDVCNSVVVYGMAPEWYCSTHNLSDVVRYHYYGGNRGGRLEECKYIEAREVAKRLTHRMLSEKVIFHQWAKESGGKLTFQYPSWENKFFSNQTMNNAINLESEDLDINEVEIIKKTLGKIVSNQGKKNSSKLESKNLYKNGVRRKKKVKKIVKRVKRKKKLPEKNISAN